jgi:predicted nucleic acid-binding protein
MRIVTNASPLIFLTKIDSLGLLQQCFSRVLVSPAVVAETGLDLPDSIEQLRLSDVGEAFVRGALGTLHRGELETLMLARERDIDLVAVDDSAARRKAVQMGLRPIGTVGILVLARRLGHLDEATAQDKLNLLVDRHGLYLSSTIIRQVHDALAEPRPDATQEQ